MPRSLQDPIGDLDINLRASVRVLQWAAAAGARRMVLASSAAVYGDPPRLPVSEDMCDRPGSPYARRLVGSRRGLRGTLAPG